MLIAWVYKGQYGLLYTHAMNYAGGFLFYALYHFPCEKNE